MASSKVTDILTRSLSGVVLSAVVLGGIYFSAWSFIALALVIAAGCLWEFYRLVENKGFKPYKYIGIGLAIFYIAAKFFGHRAESVEHYHFWWAINHVVCISAILVVITKALFSQSKSAVIDCAMTLLGGLYIVFPIAIFVDMSFSGYSSDTLFVDRYNYEVALMLILTIWANDVFAYLFGITLGKHKMFPRISPKKSWEGFVGGLLGAAGVSFLLSHLFDLNADLIYVLVCGVVIAIGAVVGDLVQSMFKRWAEVKDSGSLIPGHGGVLDRFDALLFAAPVYYIFSVLYTLICK